MSLVEQLFTELLLQSVSPGAQLWPAFKHIPASSNRLQDTAQLHTYEKWNSSEPNYSTSFVWGRCFLYHPPHGCQDQWKSVEYGQNKSAADRWKVVCFVVNCVWEVFSTVKDLIRMKFFTHLAISISGPSVTCMISTIATRSAREILSPTMNGLFCRNFSSSRLSDWFRSSTAASIFSFGTSEPMTTGNRACSKRQVLIIHLSAPTYPM